MSVTPQPPGDPPPQPPDKLSAWTKFIDAINDFPIATLLLLVLAVIGLIAVATEGYDFHDYFEFMAIAIAGLGVGRGINAAGKATGAAAAGKAPR